MRRPLATDVTGQALFALHDRDHLDGSGAPLRMQVETHLREAGLDHGGAIRLLCVPRILGYAFNPPSVYLCHRIDGSVSAILYEVMLALKIVAGIHWEALLLWGKGIAFRGPPPVPAEPITVMRPTGP